MAHPTYPTVYHDDATGAYKCEMRDKKTGRTWGIGYGPTRNEAISNARREQPNRNQIKRAIGWVTRHPFIGGATVGAVLAYHHAKQRQVDLRLGDMVTAGIIFGTAAWVISKVIRFFNARRVSYEPGEITE